MAKSKQTAKKPAPAKKTSAKKNTAPAKAVKPTVDSKQPVNNRDSLSLEIMGVIIISVSIFIILSVFSEDLTGKAGAFIKTTLTGMFGFSAYVFPFIVIALCMYVIISSDKHITARRFVSCFVLLIVISVFAHVGTIGTAPIYTAPGDYIYNGFTNGSIQNGGLIGALLGDFLVSILSKAGTYVILSAAALVCLIGITDKSFFRGIAAFINMFVSFFSAKDYDETNESFEDEPVLPAPEKEVNKPPRVDKQQPKPPKAKPAKEPADVSQFTFDIKNGKTEGDIKDETAPPESETKDTQPQADEKPLKPRILLVGEGKKPPRVPPLDIIQTEEEVKISAKLKVNEKHPKQEGEAKQLKINLNESILQNTSCEPQSNANTKQAEKPVNEPLEDEYIGDIKLKNTPDYEEEHTDFDLIPEVNAAAEYEPPPVDLLSVNNTPNPNTSREFILENSRKLEEALKSFRVEAKVIEVSVGPTVTRYELSPGTGVKVSAISNLADDLALNLAATSVRIEAPIPGKAAVGIEIPNKEAQSVFLREVIADQKFAAFPSKLAFALGKDIAGNVIVADIARMPHMLIAGSTGSGKSVCINTLVTSIIYKASPDEVKLLMIDPKVVELKVYNGIPHLMIPVVTDPKKAAGALNWAVREMTSRYDQFAEANVRDLKGYNIVRAENGEPALPQIVIIIDELADLMMTAGKEVEEYICRLAQMARAAGIHLIIATQRPSVDVITGLIKANIPSKIAFAVASSIDSRTIIGEGGAEKLLGRGDMLFYPAGMGKPLRVQGSFVSDKEVENVVKFVKQGAKVEYDEQMIENITAPAASRALEDDGGDSDEFIEPSIKFIVSKGKASASMLQRQFRIGYNRASRIIEILEERGIVGPEDGAKPRKVLMSKYEWEDYNDRRML